VPAEAVDVYVEQLSAPGALTAALNWYRAMSSSTPVDPVGVPTTYVWSDADVAVGRIAAEACADQVTGDYRFVELPGISHWIPEQAPEHLARAVLDRIARGPLLHPAAGTHAPPS
jgi:pimeloyl-ACP methyl ester carboxylesterase